MLDDDARLHHRATLIHEHGKALERPERRKLGGDLPSARREHPEREWSTVLIERDQRFLAVLRRKGSVSVCNLSRTRLVGTALRGSGCGGFNQVRDRRLE